MLGNFLMKMTPLDVRPTPLDVRPHLPWMFGNFLMKITPLDVENFLENCKINSN